MGAVNVFTAERMQQIEDTTVVSGLVDVNGDLILYTREGTPFNAGLVKGSDGAPGAPGAPGADGADGVPGTANPSASPPFSPGPGQFWVDNTTGTLYIYYVDSDGGQWIEAGVGGGAIPGRNKIINGAFRTNQRGAVSGATINTGVYFFDQWKNSSATSALFVWSTKPQGQPLTLGNVGNTRSIQQIVERENIEAGDYVLSWEGTATGRVYNVGATPPAYSSSPILVNLNGLADVVVELGGQNVTVHKVQLEPGSSPTVFEDISVDDELRRCQRYLQRFASQTADQRLAAGVQVTNTRAEIGMYLPVTMRDTPTITFSAISWTDARSFNAAISSIGLYGYHGFMSGGGNFTSFEVNFTTAGVAGDGGFIRANGTTSFLQLSAEL